MIFRNLSAFLQSIGCAGVLSRLRSLRHAWTEWQRRRAAPVILPNRSGQGRGRAGLAYVSSPFRGRATGLHSNEAEAHAMSIVLQDAGLEVVVFDFDTNSPPDVRGIDLLIGFGKVFEEACRAGHPGQTRVLYHTGAYLPFQNAAELSRVDDFRRRHGAHLRPRRCVDPYGPASQHIPDGIILLGNAWTASTYASVARRIETLDPTTNAHWIGPRQLPPAQRRGLLWMGSTGCLHKGLDLVIDAFPTLGTGWELHICGDDSASEPDFWAHYACLPSAIQRHGWVHPASSTMRTILDRCSFVILPSCSEGMATSVLAGMACGLVPIVTKETGIDVDGVGILISSLEVNAVATAMHSAAAMDEGQVTSLAAAAIERIAERHTLEVFTRRFAHLISAYVAAPVHP